MSLCKDGYWRETESYEGKQFIGSGKDQKTALKSLAKKLEAAKSGNMILNKNTTVRKWADTWLDTYIKHSGMTDKSFSTYEQKLNKYIKPSPFGDMRLKDVTESNLQKILNKQKGMSFSHASKLRMIMKQMFHRARRQRLINYDPAEDLSLPALKKGMRRSLTPMERTAIQKTAKTHRSGPWVLTMLYCGLRPGETIALHWKDIDFENGTITVSTALESGKINDFKLPKTDAGLRTLPMPKALADVLRPLQGEPFEYIFTQVLPQNKGKHHTESSLYSYWKNFKRQLDIDMGAEVYRNQIKTPVVAEDLTPYVLRHTYCTDLEIAGVPLNVAKVLMGHDDITVTANIYTHYSSETVKSAGKKINKQIAINAKIEQLKTANSP